jgi:hypothetical protein
MPAVLAVVGALNEFLPEAAESFMNFLDRINFSQIIDDVVAFSKNWDQVMKNTFDVGQWLKDMNWASISTKITEAIDKVLQDAQKTRRLLLDKDQNEQSKAFDQYLQQLQRK